MSKQRDILPRVLELILQDALDASVALGGSVSFGNERPDSDIDLLVIVPDVADVGYPGGKIKHQNAGFKYFEAAFDGIPLEVIYHTPETFEPLLVTRPWRGYKFLHVEILHDPQGLIQSWKDRIAPWFEDHPDVAQLWDQWLAQHAKRQLSKGKVLGEIIQKFPDQMRDLWPYLDKQFEDQRNAEPSASLDKE